MMEHSVDLVLEAAWKSVLISGAALLLLALLKRRSAAERACVAHFGMAAVLLLPVMVVFGPSLNVEVLAPEPAMMAASPSAPVAVSAMQLAPPAGAEASVVLPEAAAPWLDGETAVLLAFGIPASLLLLITLVAILRLFALRGRATVIVQEGWLTALAHAQRRMGIKHGTALLVSEELRSPVSWGILRPIILLNEEALDAPVDAEAVIAHELAHVARFDWLNLLVARVATATFWFNPLVWLLARQGHQLREEAADDAVLCANVPCTDYAALLVGAARHEGSGMLLAANGVAPSKGSLSMRVRRILEPTLRRGPARFAWGASCAAGALLVAGPLAALTATRPAPPSAPQFAEARHAPLASVSAVPPAAPGLPVSPAAAFAPAAAAAPAVPVAVAGPVPSPAPQAPAAPPLAVAPVSTSASASAVAVANAEPRPAVTPQQLVSMRIHGATPEYAQAIAAANPRFAGLGPHELTSFRIHGISAGRVREWASLGYANLSPDQAVAMAIHGVTPAYIRSLAELGYRGLSVDRLLEMRIHGVTSSFIRESQANGRGRASNEVKVERVVVNSDPPEPPRKPRRSATSPRPASRSSD
jgi:beta-lactamase regulating signal transducer with metallopeptidase domain